MNASALIAGYRKLNRVSVRKLAQIIGIEHTVLWRFEQGRQIETASLVKILKWILVGSPVPTNNKKGKKHGQKTD